MKRDKYFNAILRCFVLLLVVAVPLSAQSKKDKEQAKKFRDAADKAAVAKNYKEAADLYGKSLLLVPNDNYAHYRKGFAHFSLKENDQAVNELTLALNQGFNPLEIYRIRYYIYFSQGNYDAALADIQKGLLLAPNDINFLTDIGEINYARKAYPQALEAFQKAAMTAPNSGGDIYYSIARVSLALNDAKAQADAAETALTKGTRFPGETFYLLGDANQKLKNYDKAVDAYQKALGVKPNIYQIYQSLSDIFKSESKFTESIDILKKGLAQFPVDGNFYTELGLVYSLAGRSAEAVQAARSGVQILPNQAGGYTNLCRALNETKEFAQAVIACNNSLRIRPNDGETYFYLGNALVGTDKSVEAARAYSNAVRGLEEVTKKNPEQSENWYLLGNSYFADKQFDKAIESYLKCLEISPKFLRARANLGISYARKKNKAAATEQYNLLIAADASLAARVKAEIDRM
ncbi:MAG: tetratricopeptide repeat protein [Pyrinomonadaceae bacterium]